MSTHDPEQLMVEKIMQIAKIDKAKALQVLDVV